MMGITAKERPPSRTAYLLAFLLFVGGLLLAAAADSPAIWGR